MEIRRVEIKRFRGIESLVWEPPGKLACLIGRGDSTKTTILEAIELALTGRYDPSFADVDFFGLDTARPIEITVTIGGLPPTLLADSRFGLSLRGWEPESGLVDEPGDDREGVLSVKLTVDEHLEPQWVAWTERGEKPISATDRSKLGVSRIGANAVWHLVWSRRSALSRATEDLNEARPLLAGALREARSTMSEASLPGLSEVARRVEALAKKLGVAPSASYRPGLNPLAISMRNGAMSLHEGQVPLTAAGFGTQRLASIAVQQLAIPEGAILLLDEVELGLEPHRLRHLLQLLRDEPNLGQILLTSHSPVAVAELRATELCVVHNQAGSIQVQSVASDLQDTVRYAAEALLTQRIIVCEGKTEVGLCRAWDRGIWQLKGRMPLAQVGTYPIDGGGSNAPRRALGLASLGYRVALFIDADVQLESQLRGDLDQAGVEIVEWADELRTEARVCKDLPWLILCKLVDAATASHAEESVRDSILAKLNLDAATSTLRSLGLDFDRWLDAGVAEDDLRKAIGEAASAKEWFKRIGSGEELGAIVASALPEIPGTDLAAKIAALEEWAYGD